MTSALPGRLALVALGGAVGAVVRWWPTDVWDDAAGSFPWTTFAINVSGSLLLALLPAWAVARRHERLTLLLGPGVLGGYTTFSAASEQTRALIDGGHVALGGLYVVGTLAACLAAVALGRRAVAALAAAAASREAS